MSPSHSKNKSFGNEQKISFLVMGIIRQKYLKKRLSLAILNKVNLATAGSCLRLLAWLKCLILLKGFLLLEITSMMAAIGLNFARMEFGKM
jgi:hypothetical protein